MHSACVWDEDGTQLVKYNTPALHIYIKIAQCPK